MSTSLKKEDFLDAKGEVNLTQDEIEVLRNKYDIETILKVLGEVVDTLPFPYTEYTPQEVRSDWNALQNSHLEVVEGVWESHRLHPDIEVAFKGKQLRLPKTKNIGGKVSNQYMERLRMATPHARYKSQSDLWYAERKYWLKYFFNAKMYRGHMCQSNLKKGLGGQYSCSQFKPLIAKSLYDSFGARRVLDFSAGWGDRLVGALASSALSYIGIDPNTKTHPLYHQIESFCGARKQVNLICSPAEDVDYSTLAYDFVFTSPPYFDLERYSEEDTQSWKRYPKFNDWLENFLFVTLSKVWEGLGEGGRIAINISDIYSKGEVEEVCRPMLRHMESLGATYEGVLGYEMSQRSSGSVANATLPFCEPIFIWSKGQVEPPCWNPHLFFNF